MFQLSHQATRVLKRILHLIFISVITLALLMRAYSSLPDEWLFFLTSAAVENFLQVMIAYLLYHFVFRSSVSWKKVAYSIICTAVLITLACLKDYRIHFEVTAEQTFEYFTNFLGQLLLFYLVVYVINHFESFGRYQKLQKELSRAKEQLLRNQLHPHFLFNAFNSLYSLSLKSDPETPDYILKLSGMMRYLTDDTHLDKVPLKKEIDFIEKYIAIEKIRFGQDARIQLIVDASVEHEKWIEPFLLVTLVENAFKHGFYTNIKNAFVSINVHTKDNELFFTVENSLFEKQHFQENNREGKGLENLKKRLELLYPNSSSFRISQTKNTFAVYLKIIVNELV